MDIVSETDSEFASLTLSFFFRIFVGLFIANIPFSVGLKVSQTFSFNKSSTGYHSYTVVIIITNYDDNEPILLSRTLSYQQTVP